VWHRARRPTGREFFVAFPAPCAQGRRATFRDRRCADRASGQRQQQRIAGQLRTHIIRGGESRNRASASAIAGRQHSPNLSTPICGHTRQSAAAWKPIRLSAKMHMTAAVSVV
jgi:hypothetical protein